MRKKTTKEKERRNEKIKMAVVTACDFWFDWSINFG